MFVNMHMHSRTRNKFHSCVGKLMIFTRKFDREGTSRKQFSDVVHITHYIPTSLATSHPQITHCPSTKLPLASKYIFQSYKVAFMIKGHVTFHLFMFINNTSRKECRKSDSGSK